MDDRRSTAMRGNRERELREARAAAAAHRASLPPEERAELEQLSPPLSRRRIRPMAGTGQTLDGRVVTEADDAEGDIPPPYHPRDNAAETDDSEESGDDEE